MDEYLGMIKLFVGRYAPDNWLMCQGQALQISEYNPLFSLIGTTYGGDGVSTFKLPDLRMAVPVGAGTGPNLTPIALGQTGGANSVTLTPANLPAHAHTANIQVSNLPASQSAPSIGVSTLGQPKAYYESTGEIITSNLYAPAPSTPNTTVPMATAAAALSFSTIGTMSPAPHNNMQPYIVLNYIMCVNGLYPSPQ